MPLILPGAARPPRLVFPRGILHQLNHETRFAGRGRDEEMEQLGVCSAVLYCCTPSSPSSPSILTCTTLSPCVRAYPPQQYHPISAQIDAEHAIWGNLQA